MCVRNVTDIDGGRVTGVGQLIKIDFEAPLNKDKEIQYLDRYEFVDEL